MSDLTIALIALFASVALLTDMATAAVLARTTTTRRRLFASAAGECPRAQEVPAEAQLDALSPRL